ncbi:bifunctional 3'-5' exonuclease/DNA polymerase [Brachybacterium hainanense]|uniref:DNA-directed DNA polymerase n=1 Tax=Brachybacterium hainanense TaxID=1541174 RepID=A0ABV6RAP7_9MICO
MRRLRCVVGRLPGGRIGVADLDPSGTELRRLTLDPEELPALIAQREETPGDPLTGGPRWVWSDTPTWYDSVLRSGVRAGRCHDLRLVHTILQHSQLVQEPADIRAAIAWETGPIVPAESRPAEATLFDLEAGSSGPGSVPHDLDAALAELARQDRAIGTSTDPGRLRLLAAAESAGALVAAEMHGAGMPWDVAEHDRILAEALGPRPSPGQAPSRMVEVAAEVRAALGDPLVSLDSPPKLLRALHRAGIDVASTSQWELSEQEHPAIEPLLRYKKLSRLLTANGWTWIDEWVREGRYRPLYIPGGVVTGRWASNGGGALQIPRQLRPALRADPGWRLVGADVSQLEPRVLAAMAGDQAMAAAAAGQDLYAGIVASGVVTTRQEAKVGVLGALYGGTSGDSGRIVPRLRTTFPAAMGLVDAAAATGERGGDVSTWLGRSSPPADQEWRQRQNSAYLPDADPREGERARRIARDRGRFTRNFVVQGTAAEWALAWLAGLRLRLARLPMLDDASAPASGPAFSRQAHLAFFLHDEVIVHAPQEQADAAAQAIREAADAAGELLFPGSPVDFPLDLQISDRSGKG